MKDPGPWSTGPGSRHASAPVPRPPRALNPETNQPIPRLTLKQRLTLTAMNKLIAPAIAWISRRAASALAGWAVIINAPPESVEGTVAFLTAAAVFGSELLMKVVRLWFLKLKGNKAAA